MDAATGDIAVSVLRSHLRNSAGNIRLGHVVWRGPRNRSSSVEQCVRALRVGRTIRSLRDISQSARPPGLSLSHMRDEELLHSRFDPALAGTFHNADASIHTFMPQYQKVLKKQMGRR